MKTQLTTPEEIRQRIWAELSRAVLDRHHEWRTPVLATVGGDGMPNARTVVLRRADASLPGFDFYTDGRSQKISELIAQPKATLVFWSTRLNWQLRARVSVVAQTSGPQVDAVRARVKQSAAAGDYLSHAAPGEILTVQLASNKAAAEPHNLAVLTAHALEMDWLELSRQGHRRARFSAQAWEWLNP